MDETIKEKNISPNTEIPDNAPESRRSQSDQQGQISNGKLKLLIIIIVIASLVWGFVGSVELLILSAVQTLFPTRTNLQYAVMQIVIYLLLLFIIIYITDFDASSLFIFNSPTHRLSRI